ncbi:protein FRA10AC1 [Neodiprion lecontei]|uniref:Protein FRA10AC1 n=1 Tax=Neodiprion lecontei TaxID=441921 RepID=A0A6J0CCX5_NEOLC|nr:protein FRA10AC1 [Neodiprion lecontei]
MFPAYANLSAYDRHKKLMNDYFLTRKGSAITLKRDTSRDKTDADVIRDQHRFLWHSEDNDVPDSWETRLAKKYYDKLFKEYCISDLTHYKKNKVALRWRTENEVVIGKGQFQCGNKRCVEKNELKTWEVNFGYVEHGEKKNALVKLRLCPECSLKLNHHSRKREVKRRRSLKRLGKTVDVQEVLATSTTMVRDAIEVKVEKEDQADDKKEEKTVKESQIWKDKPTDSNEKSREEEFEEYFDELFM